MPVSKIIGKPEPGFGVYIHWPFCRKKCPYCDFNSHVRADLDEAIWVDALKKEIAYFAARSDLKSVTSIFFGGGTPSLMSAQAVAELIEAVGSCLNLDPNIEISLEANPTSAEAKSFAGYRSAGVNRLSMGVQSLQDNYLRFLGREHSAAEAIETIELARRHFDNISFDLIYALPEQGLSEWEQDLRRALELAGDHLSLYQLTIEPNTGFAGAYRRKEFTLPKDELAEDMFELTQSVTEDAGLLGYEISNHARPGFECRHNLTYWRYGGYLGIGPGAHGRMIENGVRQATVQIKKPESWLASVTEKGHGSAELHPVGDEKAQAEEALLMGLRLSEGVWFDNLRDSTGSSFSDVISKDGLARLEQAGLLEKNANMVRATKNGRFVLNAVLAELLS